MTLCGTEFPGRQTYTIHNSTQMVFSFSLVPYLSEPSSILWPLYCTCGLTSGSQDSVHWRTLNCPCTCFPLAMDPFCTVHARVSLVTTNTWITNFTSSFGWSKTCRLSQQTAVVKVHCVSKKRGLARKSTAPQKVLSSMTTSFCCFCVISPVYRASSKANTIVSYHQYRWISVRLCW